MEKFVCRESLPFTLAFMWHGSIQFEVTAFCIDENGSEKFQMNGAH